MTEPEYVFILDLDGTIIGNCYYQVILFNYLYEASLIIIQWLNP